MDLTTLYAPEMPPFLRDAADTPPLIRLRDVGMNCGCEYTSFPLFFASGTETEETFCSVPVPNAKKI